MKFQLKLFLIAGLSGAMLFGALLGVRSQQSATQTQRIPQFENDDVKVWRSVVLPNSPLTMHRHEHPRVIIPLVGGTMKIVESTGTSEEHHWEAGNAYWLPKNAPDTTTAA